MKRAAAIVLVIALAAGCTHKNTDAAKMRGRAIAAMAIAESGLSARPGGPMWVIEPEPQKKSFESQATPIDIYHYKCSNPDCQATGRMFRPKGTEPPASAECPRCHQKTMTLAE